MSDCIFCKIVEGKIPSRKVYEDDEMLAFHDIHPVAPVHFMIIPKKHIDSLAEAGPEHAAVLGRMLAIAGRLAREQGSHGRLPHHREHGADRRQDVYHLHIHIIGGSGVRFRA